jgi:hypothetical protein
MPNRRVGAIAMHDPVPDAAATTLAAKQSADSQDHYTGVVLIHGIGAIKRNTTLKVAHEGQRRRRFSNWLLSALPS